MTTANEVRILRQEVETLREMVSRLVLSVEALTAHAEAGEEQYEPHIVGGPEVA